MAVDANDFGLCAPRIQIVAVAGKSMERRLSERMPVTVNVYLYCQGRRLRQSCNVGNLSTRGVFVETRPRDLYRGRRVEVVFAQAFGSIVRLHRLPAVVARVAEDGAGIIFLSRIGLRRRVRKTGS